MRDVASRKFPNPLKLCFHLLMYPDGQGNKGRPAAAPKGGRQNWDRDHEAAYELFWSRLSRR